MPRRLWEHSRRRVTLSIWTVSLRNQAERALITPQQIFIDADKPNYKVYFNQVLDLNLLGSGGFIAVDNTTYKASPWAPTSMFPMGRDIHEFNQIVR